MISLGKLAAVGSASIGTATAASLTWFALSAGPQTDRSKQPANQPAAGDDKVIVCVASDSVLRASNTCSSGQTALPVLVTSAPPNPGWADWDQLKDSTPPDDPQSNPLGDLEQRLGKLQKSPLFTVVDNADNPIFSVAPETVVVYNGNKQDVAAIRAIDGGGFFWAGSADGKLAASVGASGTRAGVRITEGDVRRIELGKHESGTYSLKVPSLNASGKAIVGIGQSKAGTGALIVADVTGRVKASMTVGDGKGMIGVSNDRGAAVLSLTEGATGGGLLAIGDAKSEPMVKMGASQDRYGVVLAGPGAGFPLVPRSGLPGSYFLGCAGGPSCKPY
jgi:hypothetical protein